MKRSNLFILCIVFVLGFLVYGCYQGYHSYKKNKELYTIIDDINRLNNNISQLSQNSQIDPQLLLNYSNVYSQYVRSLQNLQGESTYNATLGSFICPNPKVYGQMPNITGGSILCTTGTMVRYDCITGTWGSCINGIQVRNDFPAMNGGTPCDANVKTCVVPPNPPEFMQTPGFGSSGLAFYINDKTNIINRDVIDYPIYFKDGNLFTKLSASNMTLYLPTLYNATYYRGQLAIPLKDANLIPGQSYTFTVKARNNVGESVGVDSLPVVAMGVPSIAINSVIPSTTSLQVNYNISGNFCNIFQGISSKGAGIYMSTDGGTTFSYKVPYYSTNPTGSYNITGLTSNKNYNIKLRTTCSLGAFYSNVVNVTTSQNCMGSWVNSGTCDKNTGLQLQTWNITQPAMYGGSVCSDGSLTNLTAGSTKNIPCLVDCEYTWPTNWSTCSGGTQYKDPNILFNPQNGGAACPTRQTQTCPMDCVMSAWTGYGGCSASCGGGTQTRTRNVQTAAINGGLCPVDNVVGTVQTESQVCNQQACPVDCVYSGWNEWSPCSGNSQYRDPIVSVQAANGGAACPARQYQSCSDCGYGTWGGWSACSATCGGGTQSRTRTNTAATGSGTATCANTVNGVETQNQACNTQACPVDCVYSGWNGWSPCSGNSQYRDPIVSVQAANGGAACPARQFQYCSDCGYGTWGGWSACSATCGGGTQSRTRTNTAATGSGTAACTNTVNGVETQNQACNTQACTGVLSSYTPHNGTNMRKMAANILTKNFIAPRNLKITKVNVYATGWLSWTSTSGVFQVYSSTDVRKAFLRININGNERLAPTLFTQIPLLPSALSPIQPVTYILPTPINVSSGQSIDISWILPKGCTSATLPYYSTSGTSCTSVLSRYFYFDAIDNKTLPVEVFYEFV